jgi:hypothetical protein
MAAGPNGAAKSDPLFQGWRSLGTDALAERISQIDASVDIHFEEKQRRTVDLMRAKLAVRRKAEAAIAAETSNAAPPAIAPTIMPPEPPALAEHAAEIRRLGKRVIQDVIEIGRLLTVCKEIVGHGGWLEWLEREFRWSPATATNVMRVYETFAASKFKNFANLDLSVSMFYLLAAPSTPEDARDQVLDRAAAGEKLSTANVKKVIAAAKSATKEKDVAADEDRGAADSEQPDVPADDHDDGAIDQGDGDSTADDADEGDGKHRASDGREQTEKNPANGGEHDAAASAQARKDAYAAREKAEAGESASTTEVGPAVTQAKPRLQEQAESLTPVEPPAEETEEQTMRALLLEEFFGQASGADIFNRIPPKRTHDVIREFLDRLTVRGLLDAMSSDFGKELRARASAPKRNKANTMKET